MLNLIPDPIQILDHTEDGMDTRHYRFRFMASEELSNWQLAQPGQFFMLNVPGAGEAPFSFTEPPNADGEFRALVRKMGTVTSALFTMQAGDILGARGPFGIGWPVEKISNNNLLIVAGGCGLAPLVSLINNLSSRPPEQQLTLIYGAKNKAAQMLTPERKRWGKTITVLNTIENPSAAGSDYSSGGFASRESKGASKSGEEYIGTPLDLLPQAVASLDESPAAVLVCGPDGMMQAVAKFATDHGLSADAIFLSVERRMHCAVGLCGHCYIKHQYVCKNGPTFTWQELQQLRLGN